MTGLTLYLLVLLFSIIPYVVILIYEYKSVYGVGGLTVFYTLLTFVPFLNIVMGIVGWGILLWIVSNRFAEIINTGRSK